MTSTTLTANQVVAYNLRKARELHGLKQEEAASRLEPFLTKVTRSGTRAPWSKSDWSAAENSYPWPERRGQTERIRQFSADEIEAFSRCFEVPIGWFFLPPAEEDPGAHIGAPTAKAAPLSAGEQVDLIYPFDGLGPPVGAVIGRVQRMFAESDSRGSIPRKYRSDVQVRMVAGLTSIAVAAVSQGLNLTSDAEHLERIANALRDAETRLVKSTAEQRGTE